MTRFVLITALMAGLAGIAGSAAAQDKAPPPNVAQGKLDVYTCASCHGIPGYNALYPMYHEPLIAGQNEQYIIDALHDYRSDARKYPTMNAQAKSLSEPQIHNIAAYLSSLAPAKPYHYEREGGDIAAGKEEAKTCIACHGANGMGIAPNFPALAGQHQDYLVHALDQYKSGERKNAIMNAEAASLSEQQIDNVAAFFASLPSKLSLLQGKVQGSDDEILHNP